jgi:16S rRNA (guanine(966)-N(2))-methyltransferase RsmD
MRIIRGKHKSKRIKAPTRLPVRPTTDFAKEALFNILENIVSIHQLKVLDLFCGTGSISYEFVSRGAKDVLAVDKHFGCVRFVFDTSNDLNMSELRAYKADAFKFIQKTEEQFNLIFADPPYDMPDLNKIPDAVFSAGILHKEGWLIVEHPAGIDFKEHPNFVMHKNYSAVNFSFFQN